MMVMLFQIFKQPDKSSASVGYSDFLSMVESGSVSSVTIQGDNISGMSAQGPFKTYTPKDPEMIGLLRSKGVKISVKPQEDSSWFQVLLSWVPMSSFLGSHVVANRRMDILHASNAGRGREGNVLRKKPGQAYDRFSGESHF
jgi:cell division protease FtsH